MHCRKLSLILILGAVLWAGCSDKSAPAPTRKSASTNAIKTFEVKGVIQEVHAQKNTLVVKHEEVPGYMPAMTMPIEVRNPKEMTGLKVGDAISFRLVDAGTDGWMENIKVIPAVDALATTNAPMILPGPTRRVREVEPLKIGEMVHDYPFTNELGQAISLGQFKGQALAVTFIFTRCPFPTFCPRMSENFTGIYNQLSQMTNGPANWHLLSLSFDPEYDTPATLQKYATRYNYDPKRWNFATGAMIEIDAFTEQLGLTFTRDPNGSISHNLRTIIIDAQGKLQRVFVGNEWPVDEFVTEMVKAAAAK